MRGSRLYAGLKACYYSVFRFGCSFGGVQYGTHGFVVNSASPSVLSATYTK